MTSARTLISAGIVVLGALLASSCGGPDTGASHKTLAPAARATYYHTGFYAGPVVFTDAAGDLVEERRMEPFGVMIGESDFAARDLNPLNKRTDVATGWSDHGARWMVPATARWLTTDPPVAAPDPDFMLKPWSLHPYQYVEQNPVIYWDPDGRSPMCFHPGICRVAYGVEQATSAMESVAEGIEGIQDGVKSFGRGAKDGFISTAIALATAARHPIATGERVVEGVGSVLNDPIGAGRAIVRSVVEGVQDPEKLGELVGGAIFGGVVGKGASMVCRVPSMLKHAGGPDLPVGPALPDSYWINKKALTQIAPGTRTVTIEKPSSAGGTYRSTTHYDQYGRQIGQTHHTDHGRPHDHPNPHHHRRDPKTGEQLKNPETGTRTWPGLFGN